MSSQIFFRENGNSIGYTMLVRCAQQPRKQLICNQQTLVEAPCRPKVLTATLEIVLKTMTLAEQSVKGCTLYSKTPTAIVKSLNW